jgi:uncharacterized damage-inducible protein DinB
MSRPILADAFAHHAWATIRLIDACLPLTADQLATSVPGTYGTILATVRHLVGGDAGYLFVLTGGRITDVDESAMSLDDLRAAEVTFGAAWAALVAQDLDSDEILVRLRDDGSKSLAPVGIRLAQALHHGSDHRSQVCTALTSLGIEPPAIDVWDFASTQGRLSEVPPPA